MGHLGLLLSIIIIIIIITGILSPLSFHTTVVRIEIDRILTNFTLREESSDPARVCAGVVDPLDPNCPIEFDAPVAFISHDDSAGKFEILRNY